VFAWYQEESPTLLLIQVNNLQKRFLGKSYRNSKVKSFYENIQSKPYQK